MQIGGIVNESNEDLMRLQNLLDESDASAGRHLREVITPDRRVSAQEVCDRLNGMRLLVLATVTSDGRPLAGPVDGIFYRGAFHFGTSPDSVRVRHIHQRPAVSATHLPGEEFAVTVHGTASSLDMTAEANAGLRRSVLDIYVPRYGPEWEAFLDSSAYFRIDPVRMFTFHME